MCEGMLIFGYVVSDVKYNTLNCSFFKVVTSIEECKLSLPRLIVGLENAKKYAFDNGFEFDILNHTYPNGDMWTFKKTEKREFYEDDLVLFKKKIIERQCEVVDYYYINIYSLQYSKVKKLYNILTSDDIKYIIVDYDMFYLSISEDVVIGISFRHLDYIGVDRDRVLNKLKSCKSNKLYYTNQKNMWDLKDLFSGKEYVIANILSKNNLKS